MTPPTASIQHHQRSHHVTRGQCPPKIFSQWKSLPLSLPNQHKQRFTVEPEHWGEGHLYSNDFIPFHRCDWKNIDTLDLFPEQDTAEVHHKPTNLGVGTGHPRHCFDSLDQRYPSLGSW